jgi:hypothetical protein
MRFLYPAALLAILLTINISVFSQTSIQTFGTGTGTHTSTTGSNSFIPNPTSGTTYARASSGGGQVVLANPGLAGLGSGTEVQGQAPTNASVVKITPIRNYTPAAQSFYTKFDVQFGTSTGASGANTGIWYFFQGDGGFYDDNNGFTSADVFTGLRFTYGTSGAITLANRNGGNWNATGITGTPFAQGTKYTVEIMGNNTNATINYTYNGAANSVAANRQDLWVNGTLVGNDIAKGAIANTSNINDMVFYAESSTSNAAWIFLDDVSVYNNIPSAVSNCSTAPTGQATFGTITPGTNDATINFAAGTGGTGRVVKISNTNSFTDPATGSNPTANAAYGGSGQQVIYKGTGTSVNVTGLTAGTTYYVAIWEYNCTLGSEVYNNAENSTNFTTTACSTAPTAQATFGTITPAITTSAINFTAGTGGTGRVVKISNTNSFTDPTTGSNPTANAVYGGSGEQVIYKGTGTSVSVSGLTGGTTYYLAIWEYNCALGSEIYNNTEGTANFTTNPACVAPVTQATFNTATTAYNQITLNFTGVGGAGRVVKFKDSNNAFTDPANNTTPTATTSYTAGTEQVVYNGTGTSVTVTNLLPGTTYYAAIYEYNCTPGTEKYNTAENTQTNTTNACPAPGTQATFGTATTTGNTATVNFVAASGGTGTGRVVKINTANSFTDPATGSNPTANTVYGGGEQVVFKGNGTSVNLTGLTEGTIYYVAIWEYNCVLGYEAYNTTENTTTIITVPNDPVLTEGCYDNTDYTMNIAAPVTGNFGEILVFARAAGVPTNPTGNASAYTGANLNFGTATTYGTSKLVYKGAPGTITITGLTTGTNYTFKAFSYTGTTGSKYSSGTQLSQTINLPEVSLPVTTPTSGQVEIVWTNPDLTCIDEVMVVANAGSVVFTPTGNGSAYAANSVYAGNNQVVFKGTTNSVLVTGLTNLTNYCFKIYTRKGTTWSAGVEVCAIPSFAQVLEPGDLLLVAVNTQIVGSQTDEVCFFSFKDITPGTSIDFTDNGYERISAGLWGETEGTIRFKRKDAATSIPAGTVICFRGSGNTASAFDINICGTNDDINWDITSLNGTFGQFNLNATGDQIWMIQNGSWSDPTPGSSDHNVTYTGNAIWGWTSTGWETAPNYASTSGSTLYPNTDCFNTNTQSVTNSDKVKYTGPTTSATQGQWITRVNTPANWTGYSTNANYNAGGSNYWGTCVTFAITAGGYAEGLWTGESDINWFNCSNWQNRRVPDSTVNVSIPTSAANNCVIDASAAFSDRFGDTAKCNNLDITSTNDIVRAQNTSDVLYVTGNVTIGPGATLDMSSGATTGGKLILKGVWDNNNTAADGFDEAGSTVVFAGGNAQTVDDDFNNENFYNVEVKKNANNVTLQNPVDIKNNLTLGNGNIITTSANLLTLEENATITSTANNGGETDMGKETSFVAGPMGWRANSNAGAERKFPIGKGTEYGPIGISPRNITSKTFTAEYFTTAPSNINNVNTSELDHISSVEYWNVTCNLNTGDDDDNAQITLYWRPISVASSVAADRQQLRVAHYTDKGTGDKWEREGNADANGAPGYGSDTWGSVTSDWVTSFSPFTFGTLTPNNALPVELLYFTAVKEGSTSLLQWSTALEINSDYFSIERSTDGGNTFIEIEQVSAAGNSTQPLTYFTHDQAPASGLNYYRLRIVDLDASYEYSNIVALNFETAIFISVYPNPANGTVTIESNSLPVSTVSLYDVTGKLVIELHDITTTKSQIDISTLPEGIYYLQVNSESQKQTFKLVTY